MSKWKSNSGNALKPVYVPAVDKVSGRVSLVCSGQINLYDDIQSHKDSVDLKLLIARFKNGENDVLNQRQGFFADVTELPKTYAEMHDLMVRARNRFDALPVDVRRQFDFDFNVYLGSLGAIVKDNVVDQDSVVEPDKDQLKKEGEVE